jgi:hypothetical protein
MVTFGPKQKTAAQHALEHGRPCVTDCRSTRRHCASRSATIASGNRGTRYARLARGFDARPHVKFESGRKSAPIATASGASRSETTRPSIERRPIESVDRKSAAPNTRFSVAACDRRKIWIQLLPSLPVARYLSSSNRLMAQAMRQGQRIRVSAPSSFIAARAHPNCSGCPNA